MASQESDFRFQKTRKFWSSKADWRLRFSLPSIILADLLGNRSFLFKKVMVCDLWLADFDPFCAFLCFKVHCFSMIVMIIDDSEKRIFEGSVWTSEFACFWNTHTYISQPTPKIPLCSIILSCCVWISWWTPRTRSFFTCMVPFLRCLLSINKARAQSELSPGAAKQTSCDLAKSNFIVLLYEKWSPYSVYYLGPCVSKIMKSSKSTLLCWKKKDKSNNRMLGENFELQVWEELATLQLLILARITTVPLILRIFSHDPAITLVK